MTTIICDVEEGTLVDFDVTVVDGGDLSVETDAAPHGTYGLQFVLDDTNALYGRVYFADKTEIRAGFYIHPNSLTMGDYDTFRICGGGSSPGNSDWRVELRYDGGYNVRASCQKDGGTWVYTSLYTLTNDKHWVEAHFKIATGVGQDDGIMKLWVDGDLKESVTTLDNDERDYDGAGLGATDVDATTYGTFYMDHLVVNDTGVEIGDPAGIRTLIDHHYRMLRM